MDAPASQHICEADLHGRSAELVVDGQILLIAHAHIHSVEPTVDVRIEPGHGQALGLSSLGEDEWPVYCLDGDLDILDRLIATRRACVLLKSHHGAIGILCDEVRLVDAGKFAIVPVPACMQAEQSLVESLAIVDANVICVLDAKRLSATLLGETADDAVQATPLAAGEQ